MQHVLYAARAICSTRTSCRYVRGLTISAKPFCGIYTFSLKGCFDVYFILNASFIPTEMRPVPVLK